MRYKYAALFMAFALVLTACGGIEPGKNTEKQGQEDVENVENEENLGTVIGGVRIVEAGVVTGKCGFVSGDFLTRTEGEQVQLLDLNGIAKTDKLYDEFESIVGDGICIVSMDSDDVPKLGVVNAYTGQEMVPCEAAEIEKLSDRYLLIKFRTGEATKDDYYGFYDNDNPNDVYGFTYFNGYGKVLDLQEGRLVPGLELTENVYAAGNMLYVDRSYKETEVFGPDGKSVGTYEYLYAYPKSGIGMQVTESGIAVYDASFQKVGQLTGEFNKYDTVDGVDDMLIKNESAADVRIRRLVGLNGDAVSERYDFIGTVSQYGFSAVKEDGGLWGYVALDGSIIAPFEYDTVHYVKPGYILALNMNETKGIQEGDVYSLEGKKLNTEPVRGDFNQCAFYTDSGIFAPETGITIPASNKQYLGCGLIKVTETAYESTIYSAITGEVVFEGVEACVCTGNNLYIWDGEEQVYIRYILEWA